MTTNTTDLTELKEAAATIIAATIQGNYSIINYVDGYNKPFTLAPRNKINTHIQNLKDQTQNKLKIVTIKLETLLNNMEELPLTQKQLDIYFNVMYTALELWVTTGNLSNVYTVQTLHPLYKRAGIQLYEFKRVIVKHLNRVKRGLNKAIKNLTRLIKKVDKIQKKIKPQKRTVLNANNWINYIVENKYNQLTSSEAAAVTNHYVTVEEKQIIKQKIRKQI